MLGLLMHLAIYEGLYRKTSHSVNEACQAFLLWIMIVE